MYGRLESAEFSAYFSYFPQHVLLSVTISAVTLSVRWMGQSDPLSLLYGAHTHMHTHTLTHTTRCQPDKGCVRYVGERSFGRHTEEANKRRMDGWMDGGGETGWSLPSPASSDVHSFFFLSSLRPSSFHKKHAENVKLRADNWYRQSSRQTKSKTGEGEERDGACLKSDAC